MENYELLKFLKLVAIVQLTGCFKLFQSEMAWTNSNSLNTKLETRQKQYIREKFECIFYAHFNEHKFFQFIINNAGH